MGKILLVNTGPAGPQGKWAEAAARRIAEYEIAAVYVCPVPGAELTAKVITEANDNVPVRDFPGLQGPVDSFWKDLRHDEENLIDRTFSEAPEEREIKLPFHEGIDVLRAGVETGLAEIGRAHRKENVAVVSQRHLTVVMILHMLHMHNRHFRQVAQAEGSINLFEVRGDTPSALYINDTCHLHGLI